jgi:hypothetical protein
MLDKSALLQCRPSINRGASEARSYRNIMNQVLSAQVLTRKNLHDCKQASGDKKLLCKMQQTCNIFFMSRRKSKIWHAQKTGTFPVYDYRACNVNRRIEHE